MDWSQYVGIPYKFGGSSREGADCWGLVRLVLKEVYGKELPAFEHNGLTEEECGLLVDHAKPLVSAVQVAEPEVGDVAVLKIHGAPCHIGVVIGAEGERNLLHTLKGHDSAIDRYDGPVWRYRLDGFYRV
jgi:murein DD-endopeptidase / murein LD-carboxypeptidase